MVKGKRGAEKYYIIISLILGLMVLGLSMYFIFQEYFNKDTIDYEECRQSIVLRANLPSKSKLGVNYLDFKDQFPLKCKTKVVEINEKNLKDARRIIAEEMAYCWALFDNGDTVSFPRANWVLPESYCVPCSRIHLTEEARKKMKEEGIQINIRDALDLKMEGREYSYFNYLMSSGNFPAFHLELGIPSDFNGEAFKVISLNKSSIYSADVFSKDKMIRKRVTVISNITFPGVLNPDNGDLIINYNLYFPSEWSGLSHLPSLFYYQYDSIPNPLDELRKPYYKNSVLSFCEKWEGIPA